jgi:hypothetical protein
MRTLKPTLALSLLPTPLLSPVPAHAQAPSPQQRYIVHLPGVVVHFHGRYLVPHGVVGAGTVVLVYYAHATVPSAFTGPDVYYDVDINSPDMKTVRAINGFVFNRAATHLYTGPGITVHTSHYQGGWTVLIDAYHRSSQDPAAQCISVRGGCVGHTVLEVRAGYADETGKSSVPCGPSTAFRDRVYRALVAQARGQ